jgi:predicted regulator of Ras-like GTPase activity (Roadblock/LC7/MglB family)
METILQRLAELSEIASAILIGKDGLIVSGSLQNDEEEMLGAISAAAFGSIASFTTQANRGEVRVDSGRPHQRHRQHGTCAPGNEKGLPPAR